MITGKWYVSTLCAVILSLGSVRAWADPPQFPKNATFTTIAKLPLAIEGLTGDGVNNLYTWRNRQCSLPDLANQFAHFRRDGGRKRNPARWRDLRLLRHHIRCCGESLSGPYGTAGRIIPSNRMQKFHRLRQSLLKEFPEPMGWPSTEMETSGRAMGLRDRVESGRSPVREQTALAPIRLLTAKKSFESSRCAMARLWGRHKHNTYR